MVKDKNILNFFMFYLEHKDVTMTPGGDAHLSCLDPQHGKSSVFYWERVDQEPKPYLYFYRGISVDSFQDQSYRGRVRQKDPEMKGGDMSLILNSVTTNDSGTYECRAKMTNTGGTNTSEPELICTVKLLVSGECVCVSGRLMNVWLLFMSVEEQELTFICGKSNTGEQPLQMNSKPSLRCFSSRKTSPDFVVSLSIVKSCDLLCPWLSATNIFAQAGTFLGRRLLQVVAPAVMQLQTS